MKIKKKILLLAIGPVLLLGIVSMALTLTMMRGSMLDEIQEALKGTAASTLAAYDQNAGQYIQSTNGDVWKGSYNPTVWWTGSRKTPAWTSHFSTEKRGS